METGVIAHTDKPPARRRHWGLKILAALLLLVVLAGYFGCVHRFHLRADHAGWSVDFAYLLCACPVCTGQVRHLTYNGRPIVPPRMASDEYVVLWAPVGRFQAFPGAATYRAHQIGLRDYDEHGDPLTPAELARGYYDAPSDSAANSSRRPGTPPHWCFLQRGELLRWCDPARLSDFTWATEPLPADDPNEPRASSPQRGAGM